MLLKIIMLIAAIYIPAKKLRNAIQFYPVDPNDIPLALIDTTVFGSAKTGMVIGLKGIYFRNDWAKRTSTNFLSWDELSESNFKIDKVSAYDIGLTPTVIFNMSGSSMKKIFLANLLNQLVDVYRQYKTSTKEEPFLSDTQLENNDEEHFLLEDGNYDAEDDGNEIADEFIISEIFSLCTISLGNLNEDIKQLIIDIMNNNIEIHNKDSFLEKIGKLKILLLKQKNRKNKN